MRSLREREDALFREWRGHSPRFVSDGAVDADAFMTCSPRIVFLLKEVNSRDPRWDLRCYLSCGAQAATWNNVVRWTKGIRSLPERLSWRRVEHVTERDREEVLRTIAVVNVNKAPGGGSANNAVLARAAKEHGKLLIRQIGLYKADLVLCCGTARFLNLALGRPNLVGWQACGNASFLREPHLPLCVDFYHPAARISAPWLYSQLVRTLDKCGFGGNTT